MFVKSACILSTCLHSAIVRMIIYSRCNVYSCNFHRSNVNKCNNTIILTKVMFAQQNKVRIKIYSTNISNNNFNYRVKK